MAWLLPNATEAKHDGAPRVSKQSPRGKAGVKHHPLCLSVPRPAGVEQWGPEKEASALAGGRARKPQLHQQHSCAQQTRETGVYTCVCHRLAL